MRHRPLFAVFAALAVAACSKPESGWSQVLPGGEIGMHIEFEDGGNRFLGHTAPRPDGGHDHVSGTYTLDAASGAVTVQAELLGPAKPGTWTGTMKGDQLELSAGTDTLVFRRGGKAHGH